MHVVRQICHRVAVMEQGRVVETGEVLEVFKILNKQLLNSLLEKNVLNKIYMMFLNISSTSLRPGVAVRIQYLGDTTAEGILSEVIRKLDVSISILQATCQCDSKRCACSMIILIEEEAAKAEEVIDFLRKAEIIVEVLEKCFNVFLAQTSFSELFHEMLSFKNVDWNEVIKATNETVYMSFLSTFYVFIIGLALGLFLYLTSPGRSLENKWVNLFLSGIINIFRSVPFIILLALLMPFTKALMGTILGPKGAIPTLVISAAPFYARLVSISLNEIPSGVVEAAESMGATTRQIITKVLIPESLPALVSGITVTTIALVGSTAVAGVIGAGGLGNLAYMIGFTRNKQDIIFVATVAILILVFLIQFVGDYAVKRIDKR